MGRQQIIYGTICIEYMVCGIPPTGMLAADMHVFMGNIIMFMGNIIKRLTF